MVDRTPRIKDLYGMRMNRIFLAVVLIFGLLVPVQGHVPLMNGGVSQGPVIIPDALKSWAIYGSIHERGEVDLYQFHLMAGDRLVLNLLVPPNSHFTPHMVVMGPGIPSHGIVPPEVQVPKGLSAMVVGGKMANMPSYEPFTPTSNVEVADVDATVTSTGSYTVAVYGEGTGSYGLAVGYLEEFSLTEWLFVPLSVISIRFWEGQSPLLIFGPAALVLAAGLAFFIRRRHPGGPLGFRSWVGIIGGLLCIGSGINTLLQMGIALQGIPVPPEVVVTLGFALIALLIGIASLRISSNIEPISIRGRAKLVALAFAGFLSWSGFLAGPVLLLISALLPDWER